MGFSGDFVNVKVMGEALGLGVAIVREKNMDGVKA